MEQNLNLSQKLQLQQENYEKIETTLKNKIEEQKEQNKHLIKEVETTLKNKIEEQKEQNKHLIKEVEF